VKKKLFLSIKEEGKELEKGGDGMGRIIKILEQFQPYIGCRAPSPDPT
jgi:hypothetical protein